MKLTKDQLDYDIFDDGVTIHGIKMYLPSEESIRVLEYPSHIERKRVTKITLYYNDIVLIGRLKQLKRIIVPSGCYLIDGLPLYLNVTVEYK